MRTCLFCGEPYSGLSCLEVTCFYATSPGLVDPQDKRPLWEPSMSWVRDMARASAQRGIGKHTTINAIVRLVLHAGVPWEPRHEWAVRGLAEVAWSRAMAGVER